ncbi:MAG: aminotransferase class I/II-fold pyridoxal phosphate-dependent enzyme [Clostridia bacterium]|nr:aminotransferase class I/II-fold pyridoxal phosphate-dependent enzyme [Clostridia bacterium]
MDTPICDFVSAYGKGDPLRLHMPGHKGKAFLGMESMDITEISGADELFHAHGVILKSEENASSLFGAGKTVYSTEGSSLCIRAMVYLALLWGKEQGRKPVILAGRNAHKAFLSAAALMDADVRWLYPEREQNLIACEITGPGLEKQLEALSEKPIAVYVTSPDYLGHLLDIEELSTVCRRHDVLLLVDNAHGAYMKFLRPDRHPMSLGADMCCDSAHKTLPVLTGGAYLHISEKAPAILREQAIRAMEMFASSSPSYLILQSLDKCNALLSEDEGRMAAFAERIAEMKGKLSAHGYALIGEEPFKITLAAKKYGYTGDELHDQLRRQGIECEFSDPDFLTMMFTPALEERDLPRAEKALLSVPRKPRIEEKPPILPHPRRVLSIREAMLALTEEIPVEQAAGRVFADAQVGCPPCIPIIACGEEVDEAAVRCFQYYKIPSCRVVRE